MNREGNRDAILNLAGALAAMGRADEARGLADRFLPSEAGNH